MDIDECGTGLRNFEFAKKKYGNEGKQIPIYANYFPIKVNCRTIYHYNIDIQVHDFVKEKGDINVPQRSRLLQQKKLLKDSNFDVYHRFVKQETSIFSSEPVFDGYKNLYSKTRLNIQDKTTFQVKQKVQEKKFPVTFDITITIPKDSNELDMTILSNPNVRNAEKELQALDIIMQYGPRRHKLAVNHNLFLRHQDLTLLSPEIRNKIRFNLGEMKEVSYGHYQSAKLTEKGTQLNIDRVAIVFNKGGKLINLIEQFCTEMRAGPPRRDAMPPRQVQINRDFKLSREERDSLNTELKGLDFVVEHISYKPKNRIFCLTDRTVSEIFFDQKTRDSTETIKTSVKDYFEKIYADYLEKTGMKSLLGNLPCVQVGKTNPKFFPIEVVSILHDQYSMKKLKPKHQAEMTRTCGQQKPPDRFKEGLEQVKNLIGVTKDNEVDYLKYFDIQLSSEYTKVKGRILDPANLAFGNNKTSRPRDGQWRPENYVIPSRNVGSDWMLINFVKDYNNPIRFPPKKQQIDEFVNTLLNASRNFGINLQQPCEIVYDEQYRGRKDLEDAVADYLFDHKNLKLLIYFIPKIDEIYSSVKFVSEITFGVVTQCVSQEKNRQFSQMSYVSNLLLKINAKLGGTNAYLNPDCKVGHLKKKTMIMGLDVTHPSRNDRCKNSIASVVSTFDSKMVNYYSKCMVQPKPRLEIVELEDICCEMLENFKSLNKFYPDYILVYRDGVSDGQFLEVIDKEINLIKKACSKLGCDPKITFLVVQKRHHTRFLPANESDRIRNSQNVLPGTVIDNTIVSNYYFDFFLCSHFGALGTSRPTRYTVLHDESEFSGDDIQKTTNLLCHLFPRCTKVVSVVPAVLYAHLSAKRARSYLFTLDNNKGDTFGEVELTPDEIKDLNKKIEVKESLRNILYYV